MRPAVALLFGAWVAGIVLGVNGQVAAAAVGAAAAAALGWRRSGQVAAAASAVLLLGFMYGHADHLDPHQDCSVGDTLAGTIAARPDIRETNIRYLVADERGCRFFVYAERWPIYERGTMVTVEDGRYESSEAVSPEQPGFARFLAAQRIAGAWSYPTIQAAAARLPDGQGGGDDEHYRALVERTHRVFSEPTASLAGALLLGDRGQFPAELLEDFRRTSLTHILSISGAHISLLTGLVFALVGRLSLRPWVRTTLVIALLWIYVWFVGAPIPAVRAGFFWSAALVALRAGLLVSLPTAILLTLAIVLTWRPSLAVDIGLQLSFLAVAGIGTAVFSTKPWSRRWREGSLWRALQSAAAVSLGATLFTWPLISHHFGLVSLSAVVANLLILPAVPIIMVGSVLAIGVSYMSPLAGYLAALPVQAAAAWMIGVARVLSRAPGGAVEFTAPGWLVPLYYGGLIITLALVVKWQKRHWREIWE